MGSEFIEHADPSEVRKSVPILRRILNWCKSDRGSQCSSYSRKVKESRRSSSMKQKDPMLTFAALCEPDPCKWRSPGCSECLPCFGKYKCIRDTLPTGLQLLDNRCDRLRAVKWLTYPADPCRLRSGRATEEGSGESPVGRSQLSPPRRPAAGRDDGKHTLHGVVEDDDRDEDEVEDEDESEDTDDGDDDDDDDDDDDASEEKHEKREGEEQRRSRRQRFSGTPSPPRHRCEHQNLHGSVGVVSRHPDGSEPRPVPRMRMFQRRKMMPTPPPRRPHSSSPMDAYNEGTRGHFHRRLDF